MEGSAYRARLERSLEAFRRLLARDGFGAGEVSIGAELEMCIVDDGGNARALNEELLEAVGDERVTLEVNRFNLEINTTPHILTGGAFGALGREMRELLDALQRAADRHRAKIVTIGILPTLSEADLESNAMSHRHRYVALSHGLRKIRGQPFHIRISGEDVVELTSNDITLEGANTALQLHLRVDPSRFGDVYDASNLAIAPALAIAANSPLLLGCDLWSETRIPLFEQSVDVRHGAAHGKPGRCSLGVGWLNAGPDALFRQAVELYPPLLEDDSDEDPLAVVDSGGVPTLSDLRTHQSTVWRWNRAVYDPHGQGHVRIEMRALPAGPSLIDMLANSAFLIGLTIGLEPEMERIRERLSFEQVSHNFYTAARYGITAALAWPGLCGVEYVEAAELVRRLVPVALRGLIACNIDPSEAEELLAVVTQRAVRRQTGAVWQRESLRILEGRESRSQALTTLLALYREGESSGRPVADWPLGGEPWSKEPSTPSSLRKAFSPQAD